MTKKELAKKPERRQNYQNSLFSGFLWLITVAIKLNKLDCLQYETVKGQADSARKSSQIPALSIWRIYAYVILLFIL